MRRTFAVLGLSLFAACAAASLAFLPNRSEASASEATFLVPANDGYGIAECLTAGLACGHIVANSWCEAQGYARAISFRQVEPGETTGTITKVALSRQQAPISITCSN